MKSNKKQDGSKDINAQKNNSFSYMYRKTALEIK